MISIINNKMYIISFCSLMIIYLSMIIMLYYILVAKMLVQGDTNNISTYLGVTYCESVIVSRTRTSCVIWDINGKEERTNEKKNLIKLTDGYYRYRYIEYG